MNIPFEQEPKTEFALEGERGEALVALLGPKALGQLGALIRLAAPSRTPENVQTIKPEKIELDKAA